MTKSSPSTSLVFFLCAVLFCTAEDTVSSPKYEATIKKFEKQDEKQPPPEGAVLFIGASGIRLWDTAKSFPNLTTINRGFGGSQIRDSTIYAARIAIPYKPKTIVFYAGGNDIAVGRTPEQVCADLKAFCVKIHDALPETRILFIGLIPSVKRWTMYNDMQQANACIKAFIQMDKRCTFIDVRGKFLGDDGTPRADLFVDDGLHPNDAGYKVLTSAVSAAIE